MRGLLKRKVRGGRGWRINKGKGWRRQRWEAYYRDRLEEAEIGLPNGKARGGRDERITKGKARGDRYERITERKGCRIWKCNILAWILYIPGREVINCSREQEDPHTEWQFHAPPPPHHTHLPTLHSVRKRAYKPSQCSVVDEQWESTDVWTRVTQRAAVRV